MEKCIIRLVGNEKAVNDFVPMKRAKGRKSLPWVTNTILYLIKKKHTLRKRIRE